MEKTGISGPDDEQAHDNAVDVSVDVRGTALSLRKADASDVPAIARLMNVSYRGVGPNAGWNSEAQFIEGDRTSAEDLLAQLSGSPRGFFLVLDDPEGGLRACVWVEPLCADKWYLGSLTVDPGLQNGGLGREVLAAGEQWAMDRGALEIQMQVLNVRDTLIAWYQRRGYRLTGETRPFPYQDARFGVPLRSDLEFVVLERSLR